MQNTRTYVVVMSKISVKMPHLFLAITSANFVIFLVSDNSTSWSGKRLHFPEINGTVKMYLFRAFLKLGKFIQTNLLQAYLKEAEI